MIKTNYSQVVFLDFDGVLHPDSVFLIGKEPKLRGNGQLFMWAPLLTEILMEFPHVKIVLSTSWVRHLGFHRTRNQLPPVIQNRIIGSTWHSEMARGWADQDWWDKSTRHDQICRYVARAHLPNWLAIDDDPAAFFKIVVASTVFSGRLFLRLLFLLPLGVECHRSDRRPVACGA
ncbi:HAD domain-containing protein [Ectopseudomonas chengduensis]|nr:HAD domain-containing protein [Pseudomonas chengduensis]UZT80861.1 HAD domain-containing protein [Pseudomonas chengduensis]